MVELLVPESAPAYPDLSGLFPVAERMQRALFDLLGIGRPPAPPMPAPWLRHGAWPEGEYPLRRDFDARLAPAPTRSRTTPSCASRATACTRSPWARSTPASSSPGHFRFSIVGEKVLRLEERLGYMHKGIDKRFEAFTVAEGYRLAGRVSGDSTVAFAWAYAQAAESLLGVVAPPRARWVRALMLERERVANHLGDLGALGNDAALGFALAQFMRLKEDWLRASGEAFGHRLLMDRVVPGGVARGFDAVQAERMVSASHAIETEVAAACASSSTSTRGCRTASSPPGA